MSWRNVCAQGEVFLGLDLRGGRAGDGETKRRLTQRTRRAFRGMGFAYYLPSGEDCGNCYAYVNAFSNQEGTNADSDTRYPAVPVGK